MKDYLLIASIACLSTVITTAIIHSFPYQQLTFAQQVYLYQDTSYFYQRIIIIGHCILFIVAMWGMCLVLKKIRPFFAGLGMICFALFSFTEIFRQVLIIFYLNGMREDYVATNNEITKNILKVNISNFGHLNYALYTIFIVAFGFGAIWYAIAMLSKRNSRKYSILGIFIFIWGIGSLLAFGNVFWSIEWLTQIIEPYNLYYQSFMRLTIGLWLWQIWVSQRNITSNLEAF